MLGNVFQQLYTVVDTMVVGKYPGVSALAARLGADLVLIPSYFLVAQRKLRPAPGE